MHTVARHNTLFRQLVICAHSSRKVISLAPLPFVATTEALVETEKASLGHEKRDLAVLEAAKGQKVQREAEERVCRAGVRVPILVDGGDLRERSTKERRGEWRRPSCVRPTSQRKNICLANGDIGLH